jgi:hypothetical protein
MRTLVASLCGLSIATLALAATDPQPGGPGGKPLLCEGFDGSSLPAGWQPGGRPGSFKIAEGALEGVCAPDDGHGPAIGVPIQGRDLTIAFSFALTKPGLVLFFVDGESQFGGSAHLLRVALGSEAATLQQDRGSLESKQAQAQEKAKAAKEGRKVAAATKEQLADPKFHRTETLDRKPAKLADEKWHRVLVEISGNDAVVHVDDQVLRATGNVFDAPKSRIVFLIGLGGKMRIDDVKVWDGKRGS